MSKIKFPFKPSEKVRAAFRQERQLRMAIRLMTKALVEVASGISDPFDTLRTEHPELMEYKALNYNHMSEEVVIGEM